jgi:hypothetical protein
MKTVIFAAPALAILALGTVCCDRKSKEEESLVPGTSQEAAKIRLPAIPPLPPDKLPAQTAMPPDPARDQYRREKVHVQIAENVLPKEGDPYAPPVPVLGNYLGAYFRRAGFEGAAGPGDAAYRIEGKFEGKYVETIVFQGQPVYHRYSGSVEIRVRGKDEAVVESVEVPEFFQEGQAEDNIVLDLRRRLAKILWERLTFAGTTFTDREIPALISSLAADDLEKEAPVQAEEVVKKLAGRGLAAVPYLLDALTDERQVRVAARYPGLTTANSDKLRVFHIADKALEEIFQKVSRLDLETPSRKRFAVIQGWEAEWRRFCPSFREDAGEKKEKEKA